MNKKQLPAWAVLMIITLVAALCLGGTYEMTKDTIAQRTAAEAEATRKALLPDASEFEQVASDQLDSMYVGRAGDEVVGYVGVTTVQGFGGDVEVTVGTDAGGTLTGIRVGGENFSETAGLGARAKDAAFTDQFKGKTPALKLGNSANDKEIDALTSSTITSNAVVRGVNGAWNALSSYAGFSAEEKVFVRSVDKNCYAYVAEGFGGDVYVQLTLDDAHAITGVVIGDENFNETAGLGAKAQEEAFYGQYIGKAGSVTLNGDVQAISGATITSTAVNDAVNTILAYVEDPYRS